MKERKKPDIPLLQGHEHRRACLLSLTRLTQLAHIFRLAYIKSPDS